MRNTTLLGWVWIRLAAVCVFAAGCGLLNACSWVGPSDQIVSSGGMTLSSSAFPAGGAIPRQYASSNMGGQNVSPPLTWSGLPGGTQSLALIMDDPDAFGFVHWVIYNIPASAGGLPENVPTTNDVANPAGAVQGINSAGAIGYFGPEPPAMHQYRFRLYALDVSYLADSGRDAASVLDAMTGHILGQTELDATFTP